MTELTLLATRGIVLVGVALPFAAACASVVRASYFDEPARSDTLLALYRLVAFAGAVVGSLALGEAQGDAAAALFAVAFCAGSLAVGAVLGRTWRAAEAAEARAVEKLRALVERYRASESSPQTRCVRAARGYGLARREEDMLLLIVEGRTQPEIARELYVSRDTVKTHVRNLYRKMGVSGKAELVEAMSAAEPARRLG